MRQNPYWKTFDPYVNPLLDKPMDLRRLVELEPRTAAAHYHEDAAKDTTLGEMYAEAV